MLLACLTFTLLYLACQPWTAAASAPAHPPAVSNPLCPAYPPPHPGTCGPFTYNYCDSNTVGCPFQETSCKAAVPGAFSFTGPPIPKDVYISPEAYIYFKMLETEYVVEFAKNPMSFEAPISLPFCGRPSTRGVRREEQHPDPLVPEHNEREVEKRGGLFGGKPPGGTLGQFIDKTLPIVNPVLDKLKQDTKTAAELLKEVENGLSHIDIPAADKPPKYHPRPVCVPRNITVPIHFTVFATNYTTSSQITVEVLKAQVDIMNGAYLDLGIQFYISSFSYHVGEEFRPFAQHDLNRIDDRDNKNNKEYISYIERTKQENRYGGFDEINVWVVESLTAPSCDRGVYTDGYCTLARHLTYADHQVDGCVINMATLPNITFNGLGPSNGSTLVHEVGHWFNLEHVFPEVPGKGGGCDGESDSIADTFQFPNDPDIKFNDFQPQCCHSGVGKTLKFFECPDGNLSHVTNYMSYSPAKGQFDKNDPLGTRPWTMGQRAHMFASFFTIRCKAPIGGLDGDCLYYPVFKDTGSPASRRWNTGDFLQRRSNLSKRGLLSGGSILRQASGLLETLKRVCATDPGDAGLAAINVVTGEEVQCDGTTCQAPPGGPICPDGSDPPCVLLPDPQPELKKLCPDGSPLPCGDGVCSLGTTLSCTPEEGFLCPDTGLKPPCQGTPSPSPTPGGQNNNTSCPKACNVHFNKCDVLTAPTCIFPDPRIANPRGACACRPGFKATGASDNDSTKHWRLPILGQEHRVWVAEGVKCDAQCQGSGFDACKEVVILDKSCI